MLGNAAMIGHLAKDKAVLHTKSLKGLLRYKRVLLLNKKNFF